MEINIHIKDCVKVFGYVLYIHGTLFFFLNSGIYGRSIQKTNTLPREISNIDKFESNSGQLKLERAKTERPIHHNIGSEEAAQIFNDKISAQQKVKDYK